MIKKYAGERIIELALFDKFQYYFNEIRDIERAKDILAELDKLFPGSEGSNDAHRNLGDKIEYIHREQYNESKVEDFKPDVFESTNYPNPFNPSTTISYNLPTDGNVEIKVYDIMGSEVIKLLDEPKTGGMHSIIWDSKNKYGSDVASGIYFYTIKYGNKSLSKKIMLMK